MRLIVQPIAHIYISFEYHRSKTWMCHQFSLVCVYFFGFTELNEKLIKKINASKIDENEKKNLQQTVNICALNRIYDAIDHNHTFNKKFECFTFEKMCVCVCAYLCVALACMCPTSHTEFSIVVVSAIAIISVGFFAGSLLSRCV